MEEETSPAAGRPSDRLAVIPLTWRDEDPSQGRGKQRWRIEKKDTRRNKKPRKLPDLPWETREGGRGEARCHHLGTQRQQEVL